MTTNQPRNFSVLTKDIARDPELLERLQRAAYSPGAHVTTTTHGAVTTVTAA
jgi:hypothetical protein